MFEKLDATELQRREDEIFFKFMERKWALDAVGVPPTHDKLFCLLKWQLDEIEAAKANLEEATAAA
ncbi:MULTISPECIES: hypothetical protein [Rhizobium]|uniref:hypothetical protein n=1 Tax=Rhizobium TaxID=379 RepID=UPI001C8307CE|nr:MULTISPECIES: hypothetical protein [unclassified Rhizobium]WSH10125.1 hypothetical protein U8P72_11465 [Rhizobium johnstonii]MBX5159064.1 hypothetical protein [Rhizobium sp. NZLR8]MBX5165468.1 hypothetical protein [Rhizobium sp. NZLR4b]MBX5173219.1 hypothetical protein [Rhizobium sp. NZLR1b]MBX5212576.1 hypothetical protein [Rhizobium sp. NZLR11]